MKLSKSDFLLMRFNIAALATSLALSLVILFVSDRYAVHALKDFQSATNKMRDARNRLNMARMDQEYLATYSRDYSKLEQRKIVGREPRLDWIEGLDRLRRQNIVLDFSYAISPQQPYTSQQPLDSGSLEVNRSEMKLQFDLLHEGQFFNFLHALRSQVTGHYQLNSCKLVRSASSTKRNPGGSAAALDTNINAECSGDWITLRNRNDQP